MSRPVTLAQYLGDEPRDRYLPHVIGACLAALLILCVSGCDDIFKACGKACAESGGKMESAGCDHCRCVGAYDGGAK